VRVSKLLDDKRRAFEQKARGSRSLTAGEDTHMNEFMQPFIFFIRFSLDLRKKGYDDEDEGVKGKNEEEMTVGLILAAS